MKILLLINSLSGGGAERVVQTLANYFNTLEDYEVVVVTLETLKDAYKLDRGIKKRILRTAPLCKGYGKLLSMPVQGFELSRILKEEQPDASISFLIRANIVHVMSRWFGNRESVFISERTYSQNKYKSKSIKNHIMRSLIKRLYPKATQISAISYGVKESLLSFGICDSKIKVIYNPQPIKKIRKLATEAPAVELCPDRKSIITVGRLVDEKDHVTLIRAFEKVRKRIKSRLYIIGDGPNREKLESLAESLDVADDVIFLGWQSNPFAILKQAELFILSSHFEGFGNVIVEAMVCGLPIVSTDCPSGPSEILKDGKAGLLVPVKDSDSLANAITKLLTDQQAYEEYSRKSLNRVNDFDVSLIAKEYLDFMKVSTESNCSSQKFERPLQNSKHQILTSQIKFKKN